MLSDGERRRIARLVRQRWASNPSRPASGVLRDALRLVAVPWAEPERLPRSQRIRFHDTVGVVSATLATLMAGSEQGALDRLREMTEPILER